MPRLWILLIFTWCYMIAVTTSEEDPQSDTILTDSPANSFIPSQYFQDLYRYNNQLVNNLRYNNELPWWNYIQQQSGLRNKRSTSDRNKKTKTTAQKETKSSQKIKRETVATNIPNESELTDENAKKIKNVDNQNIKTGKDSVLNNLLDTLERSDAPANSLDGEHRIPDTDSMLYFECIQPAKGVKDIVSWIQHRAIIFDGTAYRECVNLIRRNAEQKALVDSTKPVNSWNEAFEDDELSTKRNPFGAWIRKRNPELILYPVYPKSDIESALLALTEDDDKRVPRRKPKFHSWGGKRSGNKKGVLMNPAEAHKSTLRWNLQREPIIDEMNSPDIRSVHRRLQFNSWGGKRSDMQEENNVLDSWYTNDGDIDEDINNNEEKRTFNAWGGKRSSRLPDRLKNMESDKRKFGAWGGKRSLADDMSLGDKRSFNAWGGKRGGLTGNSVYDENLWDDLKTKRKFNSWGGKRLSTSGSDVEFNDEQKRQFNAWGGKRSSNVYDLDIEDKLSKDINEYKRQFNAWGGKRSPNPYDLDIEDQLLRDVDEHKRQFNAWGGKRSPNPYDLDIENQLLHDVDEQKRQFNAWGGKRNVYDLDIENQLLQDVNEQKRQFNAWGGKRAAESRMKDDKMMNNKGPFSAWGGK